MLLRSSVVAACILPSPQSIFQQAQVEERRGRLWITTLIPGAITAISIVTEQTRRPARCEGNHLPVGRGDHEPGKESQGPGKLKFSSALQACKSVRLEHERKGKHIPEYHR
ncbi:hypothetical protein BDV10DRAFT_158636 [Aspergillus recurvatus]